MPSPTSSSLSRHIPAFVTGVTIAAVIISFHFYIQQRQRDQKLLKRSNARRIRPRRSSRSRRNSPNRNAPASAPTPATPATTGPGAMGAANQTTVANAQAVPRPAPDELDPGDMSDSDGQVLSNQQLEQQLDREDAIDDDDSTGFETQHDTIASDYSVSPESAKENQNLLNLLYLIAEDQAKREGYVHRGVSCNSCSVQPIRGIRYRCANCVDFDLCEHCESLESHPRTHLFYKVRIPAQFLGNPRHVQPPSYPGKPGNMPLGLGMELVKEFEKKSGFDQAEVEALYEQFKCLAATEYPNDPYRIGAAINRKTFDKCIYLSFSARPPPPNLIYDRMFALYDTNNDGLIGFEEFILGLAALHTKPRLDDKWRRIFKGYDLDGDGYVERKDFLKMFRAYYTLSKEHVQDIVARMEEEMIESGASTNVLLGSQPISAAFPSLSLEAHIGEGKSNAERNQDMLGNVVLPSGNDQVTREEMERFRAETFGIDTFGTERRPSFPGSSATAARRGEEDSAPTDEFQYILDSPAYPRGEVDQDTLSDSENIPPGQAEHTLPAIMMTDMAMDNDIDLYTLAPEAEEDVGNEVLFQVTQQGLNELLNMLFKVKEDGAADVRKRELKRKKITQATQSLNAQNSQLDATKAEPSKEANILVDSPTLPTTNLPTEAALSSSSSTPPLDPTTPSKSSSAPAGSAISKTQLRLDRYRAKMESDQDKFLDKIEEEIRDRGGPGRINYEEFEKLMRQDGWKKFAFVGSWVDMVSF